MHSKKETATQPDDRYLKRWNPNEYYKDNSVAKSYDGTRFTSFSGRLFNWLEKRAIRRAFADLPNESRIADIPCGTGRLAEVLLENSHLVTGIDISAAMLSVASERLQRFGSRFSTEVSDARELSKGGERFDAVLCARFLMHFPLDDQLEFVRNVVLASRHRVVLTQGISTPLQRARRALKRLIGRLFVAQRHFDAPSRAIARSGRIARSDAYALAAVIPRSRRERYRLGGQIAVDFSRRHTPRLSPVTLLEKARNTADPDRKSRRPCSVRT